VLYLILSIWGVIIWKTHVVHARFLMGGVIIMFVIATLLAFAFLVGVVTSSTAVSIMTTFAITVISSVLTAHERFEAAVDTELSATLIKGAYWFFPKTSELGKAVVAIVAGERGEQVLKLGIEAAPFISTGLFAVGSLTLASFLFRRKEF
jgi:hypothetical protein